MFLMHSLFIFIKNFTIIKTGKLIFMLILRISNFPFLINLLTFWQ